MADDTWYYAQNNQQLGPVTLDALRQMAASGQVGPADLVWRAGMPQWVTARSVPEIGSAFVNVSAAAAAPHAAAAGFPQQQYQTAYPGVATAPIGYGGYSGYAGAYQFDYAGFWLRLVAFIIDQLILAVPFFIVSLVVAVAFPEGPPNPRTGMPSPNPAAIGINLVLNLVSIVVSWLYYAYQESGIHQATLGKRALGIKVTNLEGGPISFGQATGRFFGKILSGCILYIGFIMAAFTERKQALHDQLAGTLVVKK